MVTASVVAAALLLGLVGTTWQSIRASSQRDAAEAARAAEAEQRTMAEQKAAETDAVVDFLVNDLLGSASPEKALGRDVTVKEVLAEAEKQIDTAFADQPVVEAAIRHTLGIDVSRNWASTNQRNVTSSALPPSCVLSHTSAQSIVDTLSSMYTLARVFKDSRQGTMRPEKLHEETLEIRCRVLGPEHPGYALRR